MPMTREAIEKTLEEAGWTKSMGAPSDIVDYQILGFGTDSKYNRLILYPMDLLKLTPEKLQRLMDETNLSKHAEIIYDMAEGL